MAVPVEDFDRAVLAGAIKDTEERRSRRAPTARRARSQAAHKARSPTRRSHQPRCTALRCSVIEDAHAGMRDRRDGSICSQSELRELREFLHHPLVDLPLERHDQVGKLLHRLPAPFDEFRLVAAGRMRDVDLAVVAGEAQRVPFLRLAAIFALPGLADDLARNVVAEPVRRSRRASRPSGCWSPRRARAAPPARGPRPDRCRPAASARHASRRRARARRCGGR